MMGDLSKVAILSCSSYRADLVKPALLRGLSLLGGIDRFIQPGEKILFKPNILVGDDPEKCVSPHPVIMEQLYNVFSTIDGILSYGDSPGFGNIKSAVKKLGYETSAEKYRVKLGDFVTPVVRSFPQGTLIKQFTIAKEVDDCDGLISVSKLKSHALTRITGTIKNQFGCIPGMLKAEFHSKLPNGNLFAQMLVDLNLMLTPRLFIMDGVMAMEGNGPRNGSPKQMGVILMSTDPVALDTVVCQLVNLNPDFVEPIVFGDRSGLGTMKNIQIVGDPIGPLIDKTFLINRAPVSTTIDRSILSTSILKNLVTPRPYINPENCSFCGRCIEVCPATPKALSWQNGNRKSTPVYNYDECIRCYCCQELCPHEAINVKTPFLGRLIRR